MTERLRGLYETMDNGTDEEVLRIMRNYPMGKVEYEPLRIDISKALNRINIHSKFWVILEESKKGRDDLTIAKSTGLRVLDIRDIKKQFIEDLRREFRIVLKKKGEK